MKVGYGIKTAGMQACYLAGGMTDILGSNNIGRAEDVGKTYQDEMLKSLRYADAKGHAPGPMFSLDPGQVPGDFLQGILPGNPLPTFPGPGAPFFLKDI